MAENENIVSVRSAFMRNPSSDRRCFIGGSDARMIMGNDHDALVRLWRQKRGEIEPELHAAALADPSDLLPHVGDCDDGRVELLVDDLEQMLNVPVSQRNSLNTSSLLGVGSALFGESERGRFEDAAWYGLTSAKRTRSSTPRFSAANLPTVVVFPQGGIAVARRRNWEVLFLAIPNGAHGKGSHTHNDKLSFVLRLNGEEVVGDSGTGVYSRDLPTRNRFRTTAAHNTVLVDGVEQNRISSLANHLFLVGNQARVSPIQCEEISGGVILSASHFGYQELRVTHCRRLKLTDDGVSIEDILEGTGDHEFELSLHLSPGWKMESENSEGEVLRCRFKGTSSISMVVSAPVPLQLEEAPAPISRSYGHSFFAKCARVRGRSNLPLTIITHIIGEHSAEKANVAEVDEQQLAAHAEFESRTKNTELWEHRKG